MSRAFHFTLPLLLRVNGRLRRRQPCHRHAFGAARDIRQAQRPAELHAVGVAALLAADAQLDARRESTPQSLNPVSVKGNVSAD